MNFILLVERLSITSRSPSDYQPGRWPERREERCWTAARVTAVAVSGKRQDSNLRVYHALYSFIYWQSLNEVRFRRLSQKPNYGYYGSIFVFQFNLLYSFVKVFILQWIILPVPQRLVWRRGEGVECRLRAVHLPQAAGQV